MAAIIQSTVSPVNHPITGVPRGTVTSASRDDLYLGDEVTVVAVDAATTYAWTIAYKPSGSTAAFSGDVTLQNPGFFTVDKEGPYLIRLTVDLGLATENTQFVRLRYLTDFAKIQLVAAGEQNSSGIPVPVDQTSSGWADAQNTNLQTLLGFIARVSSSGNVRYVDQNGTSTDDILGYADHSTIQGAIDYCVAQGASSLNQWVVLVRPGTYVEDIVFNEFVHVIGWPGGEGSSIATITTIQNATTSSHGISFSNANDSLILCNLRFERGASSTNPVFNQVVNGATTFIRCQIEGLGSGGALRVFGSASTRLLECVVRGGTVAATDYTIEFNSSGGGTLFIERSVILGQSGLEVSSQAPVLIRDSQISATGTAAVVTNSNDLQLLYSTVEGPIQGNPTSSPVPGGASIDIRWSQVEDVSLDGTSFIGSSQLSIGSTTHGTLTTVNGATLAATVPADSVFYDNTTTGIPAENVQDAIDDVYAFAALVRTLDDAYDGGGVPGSGNRIIADAGPVEIVDAAAPSDPPPPQNTDGQLRVVSNVQIGAIGKPELDLDPNPFGNGPVLYMGRLIAANNTPFGSTSMVLARSTGNPDFNNYNLRLQTESSDGGSLIGRVIVRGGDALDNGGGTPTPGSVFLQGGAALGGATDGGSLYLIPGESVGGTEGYLVIGRPDTMTPATLTAVGAFVGGVTGVIRFATDMGAIEVSIDAADGLAAVLAAFNATGQVTAVDSGGGVIQLTTVSKGLNAEVHFLNDTVSGALDTALGVFNGQAQINGTIPDSIPIRVPSAQTIEFGVGGATGPMIYDADTGKLTVPGLIDPTGMIFDEATLPPTGANKGAIFVSDGSGGLTDNALYYVDETGATFPLAGAGASTTLQNAYDSGNTIATALGNDIAFTVSAAGGDFTVDGDGNVNIGLGTQVNDFGVYCNNDASIYLNANDAADKIAIFRARNTGTGRGVVRFTADDELSLFSLNGPGIDITVGTGEDSQIVLLEQSGANGEAFGLYAGVNDPSVTAISAPTGSLFVRDTGGTGELWQNTSGGGTGTTWTQVGSGGGGGEDLAATLVLGNTTGGTNVIVSDGDDIRSEVGVAVVATGTITVNAAPMTAGNKITLTRDTDTRGQVLAAILGPRVSGSNNFDGSLLTQAAIAADMVAAINDPANDFGKYTATDLGGGVLRVDATTAGSIGNTLYFIGLSGEITTNPPNSPTEGRYLQGGENAQKPIILAATSNGTGDGQGSAIQMDSGGGARGVGAVDFQTLRLNDSQVAFGDRSFAIGSYNHTAQPDSFVGGKYNVLKQGDTYVPSMMFGNRHWTEYGMYGGLIGGARHYVYGIRGAGFGPSILWGADFRIYNHQQPQAAYGAYFGSNHRWEYGNFTQTNIFAGFRHEMKATGSYVGASAVFGNQHNLYDLQATLVTGEICNVINAESAIVAGDFIHFDSFRGGGAFGDSTVVTNASTWAFSGGHFSGKGSTQFAVANFGAATTNATVREMCLHAFDTTPDSTDRLTLRASQAWGFVLSVSAYQIGGAAGTVSDSAYWTFSGLIKRDGANNTTLVGISASGTTPPTYSNVGAAAWTVQVDADDTNETLRVRVQGEANKEIRWSGYIRLTQAGDVSGF